MSNNFSGKSNSGDISEALQLAIQAAKEELETSIVTWTLGAVTGESGGFVQVNTVTVTIAASAPKS